MRSSRPRPRSRSSRTRWRGTAGSGAADSNDLVARRGVTAVTGAASPESRRLTPLFGTAIVRAPNLPARNSSKSLSIPGLNSVPESSTTQPAASKSSGSDGKSGAGLEGVVATKSEICFIDGNAGRLVYRGYEIADLVEHATFEETAYLLWNDKLPNRA